MRLDRLIVQQGDGRQSLVTDTWSATDGRHHQIDVFYEHRLGGTAPVVSFPWAGGFTSYPPGYTQTPPATAPFSFFTRTSAAAADGDAANAQGAITLQDRPTTLRFNARAPRCGRSTCARSRPRRRRASRSASRGRRRRPT